ncbi:MAG: 3-dehydroquinate synthase [Anaerolineae bacterium]|nr:3-dehydroquinate synthase [Anaerolineae bacterium]MCA9892717.1 3-dehydroquinate synthase [Anaerolineae bacterium]
MAVLTVNAPGGAYDILLENGLLQKISEHPADYGLDGHVLVTTNTTVSPLYGQSLAEALPDAGLVIMQDGEAYKNLQTISDFYDAFVAAGADRYSTVLALGGGVVGDAAGFAAATYMRGISLVQMPTTLLSMVDSSVGGKVGVDLPQGKNLVGAFKQPDRVLIDPDVLTSLPANQWRCGMAEALKHGLLADPELLNPNLHTPDRAADLVEKAVQVKINVVEEDPFEKGIRAYLNLGHTFAHAFEQVSNYAWLHGEAVGAGLLAAMKLSNRLGMCDASMIDEVDTLLAETGLPRTIDNLEPKAIYEAMKTDKKWRGGHSRFVLLRGMQQPDIVYDVPESDVLAVLESMIG